MKKIKGIIFDKDGTLFDIQRSWSEWAKVFVTKFSNQHNLDTRKLAKAINFDLASDKFVRESIFVHGSVDEVVDAIFQKFPQVTKKKVHEGLFEGSGDAKQVPLTNLHKLFTNLETITLGLVTNDSESNAIKHLEQHNLTQYFDMIIGYDSGYGSKPEPGQLEAFLRKTGLSDPEFFFGPEDMELSLRLRKFGKLAVNLDSTIYHEVAKSAKITGISTRKYYEIKSYLYFLKKLRI